MLGLSISYSKSFSIFEEIAAKMHPRLFEKMAKPAGFFRVWSARS
jgi:hypothetical protein